MSSVLLAAAFAVCYALILRGVWRLLGTRPGRWLFVGPDVWTVAELRALRGHAWAYCDATCCDLCDGGPPADELAWFRDEVGPDAWRP